MDLETAQTTTTTKLPILKQGEYDMWRLRIEQYFQVQDYALWDVIENGNSFNLVAQTTTNADGTSTSLIPGPVTTEEKAQKKNDVKARSMLLMAFPNEHLMTFNQYKDAKTLFAAIQTRFGGNEAAKKNQKTLLMQMYENFSAPKQTDADTSLVDGKKVIITEMSVRRALRLKDAEGIECLPNATIFAELERMGYENVTQKLAFYKAFFSPQWKFLIPTILQCLSAKTTAWNKFSSTMASAIICHAINQKFNFSKYIFDNMVKNLEGGVKFLIYPRKNEKPITDEAANEEQIPIHSNDPLLNGEDRLKLNELMELCTNLSQRVLYLENTKTSKVSEIAKLKERVKKLERRNKSRTPRLKRLRKVGRSAQVVSSEDEGLGAQEDASKQERKIVDLDADAEEVKVEKAVSTAEVTTVSATTTAVDELTLAQTLIEIKATKPKVVTTAATTTTTAITRPKARGVVVQEPSEFTTTTSQSSQLPQAKDKGKEKMIEPDKPLKKKDQILIDEEIAQILQEELNAELEEEEKISKQREEDANIAEWDNVQAMIDANYDLAARLQAQEQEELTIEEKSKLFVELMDKRNKYFARLRAEEQRRKTLTKA
ncbi:hypothetical protein Tco_0855464 [Tanacetum coccineum]